MPDLKNIKPIISQIIVIFLITFCLSEVVLRLYNYHVSSYIFHDSSYNRFRGKPFGEDWHFKLNSLGFKDTEFTPQKKHKYRILGIGDSFAFGVVPYQHNYLTLIESRLKGNQPPVEVYNMGIPSIGPKEYLSILIKEGLELDPDMVLLSFFVGNDIYESKKRKLHQYSYVISLLSYLINLKTKYEGIIIHRKADYCDDCPTFNQDHYLKIAQSRSSIYLTDYNRFNQKLDTALFYLREIQRVCRKNNIKLVVTIIPDEIQINPALEQEVKKVFYPNIQKDAWQITRPNTFLSKELSKLNIHHIDLYDDFSVSSQQLYRPRDSHWNIAGNHLAAEIISKQIQPFLQ